MRSRTPAAKTAASVSLRAGKASEIRAPRPRPPAGAGHELGAIASIAAGSAAPRARVPPAVNPIQAMFRRGQQPYPNYGTFVPAVPLNQQFQIEPWDDLEEDEPPPEHIPQVIENPPQVIENPPQFIENPPQVIENPPQVIENQPQVIENPPQVLDNQPQVLNLHEDNGNIQEQDQDEPRRPQGVSGQNVLDFITANSPGPITGVSGLATATSSLLNPPTTKVSSRFANSNYVKKLNAGTNITTKIGIGANAVNVGADVLGTGVEAYQFHQRFARDDNRRFGGLRRFFGGLGNSVKRLFGRRDADVRDAEERSAAKRLLVNSVTNAADVGLNQVPTAVSGIMGSAAPSVLGPMAAGAGAGISALVALRSFFRGGRAAMHKSRVGSLLKPSEQGGLTDPAMRQVAQHHQSQLRKRTARSVLGGLGATAGAVGGGLLLAGLLGATALTPVGWALAAAGGLAAAGLGAYKLYRWNKKRREGRLGLKRQQNAEALHEAATNPMNPGHQDAHRILTARGIRPEQIEGPEGLNFLKRKAEGW